jgi:hypothetical protein
MVSTVHWIVAPWHAGSFESPRSWMAMILDAVTHDGEDHQVQVCFLTGAHSKCRNSPVAGSRVIIAGVLALLMNRT